MSNLHPTVSIGLPVYNGEKYLARTLESVLNQTYQDFELIVCDNASTDSTREIIYKYMQNDKRIYYYKNKQNIGAVANYQRTLNLAKGKYFRWIAADDLISSITLQESVQVLENDPSIVLTYTKSAFIDEIDQIIHSSDDVVKLDTWPDGKIDRTCQLLKALLINGSTANIIIFGLCPTEFIKKIKPLGNYFGCDYVFTTDIVLRGKIFEIPKLLSFYRRHSESSSSYKKSPSAKKQQEFYDPRIKGRIRQEFQLRRRYIELLKVILDSDSTTLEKIKISSFFISRLLLKAIWRLKFEYYSKMDHSKVELQLTNPDIVGIHWQDISNS